MTNKVHGTHLMLLGFLVGDLSLIKFCQMKQLTPILIILHFQCFFEINLKWTIFSLGIHKCILLIMQSNCLLCIHKRCYPSVAFLKLVSIFSQAMKICYSKVVFCLHLHFILPLAFFFLCKCTIYFEHAHL